jgi:hypothetical protein
MHDFHIPVMGLAFTIDSPLKVAHYGISSVISIVDDDLIEKMRKVHSLRNNIEYVPITLKEYDHRAKRITAYLNLINLLVGQNFEKLKTEILERGNEAIKYRDMLPDKSPFKMSLSAYLDGDISIDDFRVLLNEQMTPGSIDVNIMTKVDNINYGKNREPLPVEFNDAHAALRGYANSNLRSSIVLSAGMNQRLYSYIEKFADFIPDINGNIKKKITIKVSDYRSALIQGKFLAKKGIWVSEYRIESGLNCGGHAFASDGYLMGPILEEFKKNRDTLTATMNEIFVQALQRKNLPVPLHRLDVNITAQGGVGTAEEHSFLLNYYQLDSVGWGTPFLLVPEVTNVDAETLDLLCKAKEDDLYLSNSSPLGVPFNNLRGSSKEVEKIDLIIDGKPGSSCPKKFLISNSEFPGKAICTASAKYQSQKISELDASAACGEEYEKKYKSIVEKTCLCVGLATSVLKMYNAAEKMDGKNISICPGPNMAYFSTVTSLKEMVDHIYGRINLIVRTDRPNMFIKELRLYLDYLKERIAETNMPASVSQVKYFETFQANISNGIQYYKELFSTRLNEMRVKLEKELFKAEESFNEIRKSMAEKNLISAIADEIVEKITEHTTV